jgi:putative hydrolase of the HAD superfamily
MNIQAVFFDMGGTIDTHHHDRASSLDVTEEIRNILSRAGVNLANLDTETLYTVMRKGLTRYRLWREETLFELPPERIWREFVLQDFQVALHQLDGVAEELAFTVETRYFQRQMRPEIPEVLDAIQQLGLKMGIISNVQSRSQVPGDLKRYHLLRYFDPIVMSSVYGRRKPDPSIFHYAASLAQVPTSACVYIGDRISRDILGARRAGYALAVQIRHGYKEGDDPLEPVPDAIIGDMRELVDILKQVVSRSIGHTNHRKIQAILFDASDILYFRPNKGKWLKRYLADLGLDPHSIDLSQKQQIETRAFKKEIDTEEYYTELLRLYGVQGDKQLEVGKKVLEKESDDIEIFEGVRDTLIGLKERRFLLGIVTDTVLPTYKKLHWFEQAGFGHVWDVFTSSRNVGIRKPNPGIYQAALRQLGVTPEEAVFVGHNASEIQGAAAVGLTTIAFNYEDGVQADIYVEHFADLLKLAVLS